MWNQYLNYSDFSELKHRKTFAEIIEEKGYNAVFAGTDVDAETQNALVSYFSQDRINAPYDRWNWNFRRNLNLYYPVYKEQLEQWTERKTKEWYFDNIKTSTLTRETVQDLDETHAETDIKNLTQAIQDAMTERATLDRDNTKHQTSSSKIEDSGSQTQTENYSSTNENDTDKSISGNSSNTETENDKHREFGFNYPESNYQGGVIPYDLTNNPSVEFINNQADALDNKSKSGSSTKSETDDTHSEGSESGSSTQNNTDQRVTDQSIAADVTDSTDETKETTKTDTRNTTQQDNRTNNKQREVDSTNNVTETKTHQGDNINTLAEQLIKLIPSANFFKQFTAVLYRNFQQCYLVDEILEEYEEEDE